MAHLTCRIKHPLDSLGFSPVNVNVFFAFYFFMLNLYSVYFFMIQWLLYDGVLFDNLIFLFMFMFWFFFYLFQRWILLFYLFLYQFLDHLAWQFSSSLELTDKLAQWLLLRYVSMACSWHQRPVKFFFNRQHSLSWI